MTTSNPSMRPRSRFFRSGATARRLAIGVDIGGTKVAAGVVDPYGKVLAELRSPTPGADARDVEKTIAALVHELGRAYPVASVGIGAAGWMDLESSTVLFSPHLAWRNEPLQANLERLLNRRVVLANDADAAGWAEWRFGAGRGHDRIVCLTLGTGIGGSMVRDGVLERGSYGLAGEFGHQVIMPEGTAASAAIAAAGSSTPPATRWGARRANWCGPSPRWLPSWRWPWTMSRSSPVRWSPSWHWPGNGPALN